MKKFLAYIFYNIIYELIVYMPTLIGVKLREIMFRLLTGQIGKNPKFGFGSKILNAKNITIGNNFDMGDFSHVIGGGGTYNYW